MPHRQNQQKNDMEVLLQKGIDGIKNGQYKSVYHAAKILKISETTLRERFNGRQSPQHAHESQQILSDSEEKALAKWITTLTLTGLPPSYSAIKNMVDAIRARRAASVNTPSMQLVSYSPLGKRWVSRFITRHRFLKSVYARRIDANRADQSKREVIERWFNVVAQVFAEYDIDLENVYDMDESGFNVGIIQVGRRVMDSRCNVNYRKQPGRHEWVTVLECICADGTPISPLVIFKGEKLISEWILPANPEEDWRFACSRRGWTNDDIGLEWLRRCFEPETREKADGKWRVLIVDGHGSHVTDDFITQAYLNNIILLRLPSHTSHLLQPLDVGLFGPLKKYASDEMEPLVQANVSRIRKEDWLLAYLKGRQTAFRTSNVFGGWRGAGLVPFNPTKVLDKLPSQPCCQSPLTSSTMPTTSTSFNTSLITNSPPDAIVLQSTNQALNDIIDKNLPLQTPERRFIKQLTKTTERLQAQNSILEQQNKELQDIVRTRKERKKGRQVFLDGQIILTTKEIREMMIKKNREEKQKQGKRKLSVLNSEIEIDKNEDMHEERPSKKRWILSAVMI